MQRLVRTRLNVFFLSALWVFVICPGALSVARANYPNRSNISDIPNMRDSTSYHLVQSIPLEVDLAQQGVAMTTDTWVEMIAAAKSSIDLAQFYVSNGGVKVDLRMDAKAKKILRPLDRVLDELEKATKRGVKIRLLVSSSLTSEDPQTLDRFRKMRGAQVRILDLSGVTGGVHHAKYWVVDKKEVFIGSQNFDWRALNQIHELGVRAQDSELAKQLGRIFEADWKLAKGHLDSTLSYYLNSSSEPKKVELVASPSSLNPANVRPAIQSLVELLGQAKSRIRLQLMEYSPLAGNQVYWPELDNALRSAALRGVKIQILVSNGNPTLRSLDYLRSLAMTPGIEVKLVTFPQYSGGFIPFARMIHSKYMVVDEDVLWIGTSNWSKGYFYNSRNVELILRRPELSQAAGQIFQRLWDSMYAEFVSKLE